jgi:transposase
VILAHRETTFQVSTIIGTLPKILWWDRDGLAIYYKRIERGTFQFPRGEAKSLVIDSDQLMRLLSGLELAARRAS